MGVKARRCRVRSSRTKKTRPSWGQIILNDAMSRGLGDVARNLSCLCRGVCLRRGSSVTPHAHG